MERWSEGSEMSKVSAAVMRRDAGWVVWGMDWGDVLVGWRSDWWFWL
jgi:hypothetical protein